MMKSNLLTKVFGSMALLGALSAPVNSQAGDGVNFLGMNFHMDTVVKQRIINVPVYKNVPVYAHTCQGPEFLGYQHRFEGYCPQVKTVVREKLHVTPAPCRPRPYTCTQKPITCAPVTCSPKPYTCVPKPVTCAPVYNNIANQGRMEQTPTLAPPQTPAPPQPNPQR